MHKQEKMASFYAQHTALILLGYMLVASVYTVRFSLLSPQAVGIPNLVETSPFLHSREFARQQVILARYMMYYEGDLTSIMRCLGDDSDVALLLQPLLLEMNRLDMDYKEFHRYAIKHAVSHRASVSFTVNPNVCIVNALGHHNSLSTGQIFGNLLGGGAGSPGAGNL